jgi:hypothetical protein
MSVVSHTASPAELQPRTFVLLAAPAPDDSFTPSSQKLWDSLDSVVWIAPPGGYKADGNTPADTWAAPLSETQRGFEFADLIKSGFLVLQEISSPIPVRSSVSPPSSSSSSAPPSSS